MPPCSTNLRRFLRDEAWSRCLKFKPTESEAPMNRKLGWILVVVSVLCGFASAADKSAPVAVDPAYKQSFEKWKGELVDDLKQEWLPLAGLFWLKPGENSFGTDAKNAIVFPKGPAHAGSFTLRGQVVTVKSAPGVNAVIAGKPATTAELQPDTAD